MDYAIQKATELGVRAIQPLASERSVVRLSEERADRRLAHWRNIAAAACEQCGRNRLPEVRSVATLGWLSVRHRRRARNLLLAPSGTVRLREVAPAPKVTVMIGPEGGLSGTTEGRVLRAGIHRGADGTARAAHRDRPACCHRRAAVDVGRRLGRPGEDF